VNTPTGRIVRQMRLTVKEGDTKRWVTGSGILVRIRPNTESRRTFARFCAARGVIATPTDGMSYADGTYSHHTGELRRDAVAQPHTFQCIGDGPDLAALRSHPAVESWEFAVGTRIPFVAGGSGTLTERGERSIREGKRESGYRAAETARAEVRPYVPSDPHNDSVWAIATQLGISPANASAHMDRLTAISELLRRTEAGEAPNSPAVLALRRTVMGEARYAEECEAL
jgi:hypothetical protein